MKIIPALLGEHGAMYPLLDLIETSTSSAGLEELKIRTNCLQSTLSSHATLEDELLRPIIKQYLPPPAVSANGTNEPTDHEIINAAMAQVLSSMDLVEARRLLLDIVVKTRKHFLKEEKIIFSIAGRELTTESQEQLGAEWARRRGVLAS